MALPSPNLDDRRFQDLVDDAKRLLQQRCPDWTDHNVSDPGVTLIELFAWMTDQLLYRVNRIPDRNYLKFLDLVGVKLFPPRAATADVTFWLSAPQDAVVVVPAGTQVATVRTESDESVLFTTTEELRIVSCSLGRIASTIEEGKTRDHTDALTMGTPVYCFDQVPKPGDALLIGLSDAVPSCAVTLRFVCETEGVGVDPTDPPLAWEAWSGESWQRCILDRDETGGLNASGDVVIHVPAEHTTSLINKRRAGWIRCAVVEASEKQPRYSASPKIVKVAAFTTGGTAGSVHAEVISNEVVGFSEGVAGQRFNLLQRPVAASEEPVVVEVGGEGGWTPWTHVPDFSRSSSEDTHFVVDPVMGEIAFGPAVRQEDGSLRHFGAIPEKGAGIRVASYRVGGGRRGNVARRSLTVLKSSVPFVTRVENRKPAQGGVDVENIESAKERGPIVLRSANRAVTAEDYEQLTREAAPEIARVRCVPVTDNAGAVRVLVVPSATRDDGRLRFDRLVPAEATLERIRAHLDERRVIGARISIGPPAFQGVTIVARIRTRRGTDAGRLQAAAVDALYHYFDPLTGGLGGQGWPFGRPVHVGEVFTVLQGLGGTLFVEDAALFAADPRTGERGPSTQRLDLDPDALLFSYEHQVLVEES